MVLWLRFAKRNKYTARSCWSIGHDDASACGYSSICGRSFGSWCSHTINSESENQLAHGLLLTAKKTTQILAYQARGKYFIVVASLWVLVAWRMQAIVSKPNGQQRRYSLVCNRDSNDLLSLQFCLHFGLICEIPLQELHSIAHACSL